MDLVSLLVPRGLPAGPRAPQAPPPGTFGCLKPGCCGPACGCESQLLTGSLIPKRVGRRHCRPFLGDHKVSLWVGPALAPALASSEAAPDLAAGESSQTPSCCTSHRVLPWPCFPRASSFWARRMVVQLACPEVLGGQNRGW